MLDVQKTPKVSDYLQHCGFKPSRQNGSQVWTRYMKERGRIEVIDFRESFVKVYAYKIVDRHGEEDEYVKPFEDHYLIAMHALNMMLEKEGRLEKSTMFDLTDEELDDLDLDEWQEKFEKRLGLFKQQVQ